MAQANGKTYNEAYNGHRINIFHRLSSFHDEDDEKCVFD